MRLTEIKKLEELRNKETRTEEENIYLKLGYFETEMQEKRLFNKLQLNKAIIHATEMLANMVKVKLTKEIVNVIIAEAKESEHLDVARLEDIGNALIKMVEGNE